ncbi:MAG TPA: hypothetical protein DD990_23505 [Cyanobacteria bacterium UBA11368]|nr:hypothetical protein [Cyanobacteria bacterium UBA11368]
MSDRIYLRMMVAKSDLPSALSTRQRLKSLANNERPLVWTKSFSNRIDPTSAIRLLIYSPAGCRNWCKI